MPLLEDIKGVLNFSAFRPDPDDSETAWAKRFAGRRSLLLNVSRTHTSWRSVNKRGKFQESGAQGGIPSRQTIVAGVIRCAAISAENSASATGPACWPFSP